MKKIFEFLKKPYTSVFLSVVGLTSGFFIGIAVKQIVDLQNNFFNKKQACKDAFDIMCIQAHNCTGGSIDECDSFVEENEMCNINLPDLQLIYNCKQELRHIECEDNMPTSCSLFME